MTEHEIREEICRVGKSLFDRGYVHATAGNVSVQLSPEQGGGFLITPTDACLGHLAPERLARLNAQGEQISGDRASKTILLHRSIYEASAKTDCIARCIIHTHSTHCVALTLDAPPEPELLPALTPYFLPFTYDTKVGLCSNGKAYSSRHAVKAGAQCMGRFTSASHGCSGGVGRNGAFVVDGSGARICIG